MIYFINGRPGGGKSLTTAEYIYKAIKRGKNVIANFEINMDYFAKCRHPEKLGRFLYVPNVEWQTNGYKGIDPKKREFSYIDGLYGFACNFHRPDHKGRIREGQTLLVLDECADLFNSRTYNTRDRLSWCSFFRQHRKLGYTVYLVAQDDGDVDKQIRELLQKEIECRCVSSMKFIGRLMGLFCGGKLFIRIFRDYTLKGTYRKKDAKEGSQFFRGKKYYDFYDSYKLFGGHSAAG